MLLPKPTQVCSLPQNEVKKLGDGCRLPVSTLVPSYSQTMSSIQQGVALPTVTSEGVSVA
jgi:hypothetical protein